MTIGRCKRNTNPARERAWTIKDLVRVARYVAMREGVSNVCAALATEFALHVPPDGPPGARAGCHGCKVNCAELRAAALAIEVELDILEPVVNTILEVKGFADELVEAYNYLVEKVTELFSWIGGVK